MSDDGSIRIHKYGNRRLYRTDLSRYVVLSELAQLIRDGQAFIVLDAKSGEDLTATVLAQIILDEQRSDPSRGASVELLRAVVRARDARISLFLECHLPRLIELYLSGLTNMEGELERSIGGLE